jgi:hypothetical protein
MVYSYKRKRERSYSINHLQAAVNAVKAGATSQSAAFEFGVPRTTILDHVRGTHTGKHGHRTVLTNEEEETIVSAIEYCGRFGWPCTRVHVRQMVQDYCKSVKRSVPWGPDGPGDDFLRLFDKRWAHRISKRKTELLTAAASKSLSNENLQSFFDKVMALYDEEDLHAHPERVFNADETGLNTDGTVAAAYLKKGTKVAVTINPSGGKVQYSVLICGNAVGTMLPPFVVYRAKNLYDTWCRGGPPGTQYACTKSGWMESEAFLQWMEKVKLQILASSIQGN